MKTIHKYPLTIGRIESLDLPERAEVLDVQMQNGRPMMWALVETGNATELRHFAIFGTGHSLNGPPLRYIATVQEGPFVWHAFEMVYATERIP